MVNLLVLNIERTVFDTKLASDFCGITTALNLAKGNNLSSVYLVLVEIMQKIYKWVTFLFKLGNKGYTES